MKKKYWKTQDLAPSGLPFPFQEVGDSSCRQVRPLQTGPPAWLGWIPQFAQSVWVCKLKVQCPENPLSQAKRDSWSYYWPWSLIACYPCHPPLLPSTFHCTITLQLLSMILVMIFNHFSLCPYSPGLKTALNFSWVLSKIRKNESLNSLLT